MKKETLLILSVIIISIVVASCAPEDNLPHSDSLQQLSSEAENKSDSAPMPTLGNLCSGERECISFCEHDRGRCEDYCQGNHKNALCLHIFPPTNSAADGAAAQDKNQGCIGTGTVTFTSSPLQLDDLAYIEPIGLMIGGHVTPIDHGYYYGKNWHPQDGRNDPGKFFDVIAPADAVVRDVQRMPSEYQSSPQGDYRIVLDHSCTFYTIYIHVNQLSPQLQAVVGSNKKIQVKAGEVIGRAPAFDFSVHDEEVTLAGFVVPEHYEVEPWKIHTVDMFASFVEPLRTQLLEKNIRQQEPFGGKIDYDRDGKLVGNWFEENTNGYFGKREYQRHSGYWSTHLSFVYDGLDPSLIIVSTGDFNGEAKQFAVKGNTPDPADVNVARGLIKYELVSFDYNTEEGKLWDHQNFAKMGKAFVDDQVAGTVLVQMLEDRKIKFESFPGKTAEQVAGFTEKAKVYER